MEFRHTTIEAQDTLRNQDHWSILPCPSPRSTFHSYRRSSARSLSSAPFPRSSGAANMASSATTYLRPGLNGGDRADGRRPGRRTEAGRA